MRSKFNALRLVLTYFVLASLWVLFSDRVLLGLVGDRDLLAELQTVKGLAFVAVTSLLLFGLICLHLRSLRSYLDARRAHESSLRQAAAVFDATQEGVLVTDATRSIVHVNRAFARITGYEEAEVLGHDPRLFSSGRHSREFYNAMWHALDSRREWSGEVWNRRKDGEIYPLWQNIRAIHDEDGVLTHYVAVFSDISAIKRSQNELDFLAHHDPLTNLPNRLLFTERVEQVLERCRREHRNGAILLMDLDHFKHINESLGPSQGDLLLKMVGTRLQTLLEGGMTLARLGGDEFGLLWDNCPLADQAAALAERIRSALATPFRIGGHDLFISTSLGISLLPEEDDNVERVMRNADSALFKAKSAGRDSYAFYSQELTAQAQQRVEMVSALRVALERDQLRVHYQPIRRLADGRLIGFEALVRWEHPERGLVSPGEFLPVAEDSGLIGGIDVWVLERACRQIQQWLEQGHELDFVAVNLSCRLFRRTELEGQVARVLAATGLPPGYLELEITESAVMEDPDTAEALLSRLRQLGVRLAIDDFGTGYSSLQRLKRLPVHKLKIDQSFVRGLPADQNDIAIARAVTALGHSLGLAVLAEGIETADQATFLRDLGCEYGQGYLFSRPVPAEEVERLWSPV
ncbi:phosphodiesterase DibA [Metapseudomonas furukawaii]|jgi:diguanylate cyclase (GGDEF)-like protein/PAS domain S-box-containing protein|uniref:cyclic-guanylate-specific phosphodiesterase n=1 Tax=Metapseudomonas furukawaii TaxID=1149133 RepID=L8MG84_METFU|nr:EAL domain-containing protein [Pseudomonas furukawaii]ELS25485.1 Sensory box/GGDEF/EAL domains containing protein [Pseudomonas furukawaii]ELS25490.1 Sensory box/GGDEF/EAL domain containing protein [Pseudomonas furukawaii]BAU71826.1 diguanylate cyclase/phosphodiesterase domain 2 EAL protein [Pseudomonas furukawaii]